MRITSDQRVAVESIREAFKAGKIPFSASVVANAIVSELGISVKPKTVSTWLNARN